MATPGDAGAAAIITVVSIDDPIESFNDGSPPDSDSTACGNTGTTPGQLRLIAFQRAADIWGRFIDSNVEIEIGASFDPLPCSAFSTVVGAAGPEAAFADFTGAPRANTFYPVALANALFGSDLDPGVVDIGAFFNSAIGTTCPFPKVWYYGLDAKPPANTIDFLTIVLHEISPGLGFISGVDADTGAKLWGLDDAYMVNLENHLTGELYPTMTNAERVAASTSNALHWVGPNVVAAGVGLDSGRHPSGHVEMYAPFPQQGGSSVSHFSDSLGPEEMMEPFYTVVDHGPGLAHDLMADIGWSTATRHIDADLSGDRASDIVWRNTRTGSVYAWLMNGFQKGVGPLDGLSLQWEIKGLGDFDGIGEFDILWRNKTSRSTVIWQMNAFRRLTIAGIGQPSAAWEIVGVGDFNADGTTDILWINKNTGRTVIWRMRALAKISTPTIGTLRLVWKVVGVGDFDGDETDDILWRNKNTDSTVIWRMVNLARNGAKSIGRPSESWQVACVGDYDGAAADILWRNANNGRTVIWQMDGFDRTDVGTIGAPSDVWQIRC